MGVSKKTLIYNIPKAEANAELKNGGVPIHLKMKILKINE